MGIQLLTKIDIFVLIYNPALSIEFTRPGENYSFPIFKNYILIDANQIRLFFLNRYGLYIYKQINLF